MNNKIIKISIIIPCFNSESTIERTLLSIINQNYSNLEIIIIDGASTDNTLSIVNKYSSSIYRVVSEPDDGIYDAINKGLAIARGDLIGMISANDWLTDNAISHIIEGYNAHPDFDIYHANIYQIKEIDGINYIKENKGGKPEGLIRKMTLMHPSCFVKREWYKKYKFDNTYRIAGDYEFILKSFLNKAKFCYIDKALVIMSDGGMSTSFKTTIETVKIQRKYHLYKEAILLYIYRVLLFAKSKLLRSIANILFSKNTMIDLEIRKWNGTVYNL